MEDAVSNSFMFEVTTFAVHNESSETASDNSEGERLSRNTMPEIYSRYIEAKKICDNNLCSYISFEQLNMHKAIILCESHSYNLEKLLQNRIVQKQNFREEELGEIMFEILKGLCKLSSYNLAYLDLKSKNVIITSTGSLKLAHPFDSHILGPELSPNPYLPVETSNSAYLYKIDSWSLGIIMAEFSSLMKVPLITQDHYENFISLEYSQTMLSQKFREIILSCLDKNPSTRWDIIDLYSQCYFVKIPKCPKNNFHGVHIYYLWLRYKNIDSIKKFEQYLVANGIVPYIPPVLQIPNVIKARKEETSGISVMSRVPVSLDGLLQEIKKDVDCESVVTDSKLLFNDEASAKPESFMGKIGHLFRSKSAKSTHSESSMRSKHSDTFSTIYKKFKNCLKSAFSLTSEFLPVPTEGFPISLRPVLWRKFLKVPYAYPHLYSFLYDTRRIEINKQISLDIPRCHKNNLFLMSSTGQKRLETLLKMWLSQHQGVKYSQGLDSIAAACICCFEDDEAAAYFAFDQIIEKYLINLIVHEELIGNYLLVLRNVISFIDPPLSQHLSNSSINPEMYATSWLLTLYARIFYSDVFPLTTVYTLWDLLLQKPPEFIYIVAFCILQQFRKELLERPQNEIITFFSGINGKINLELCMKDSLELAEKVPLGICRLVFSNDPLRPWLKELPLELAQATRSPMISLDECLKLSHDTLFVDTRSSEEYNKLRVNGSVNLPLKTGNDSGILPTIKLTQMQLQGLKNHAKGKIIILIGDNSLKAHSFGNILVKLGVSKVCILRGGIECCKAEKKEILTSN